MVPPGGPAASSSGAPATPSSTGAVARGVVPSEHAAAPQDVMFLFVVFLAGVAVVVLLLRVS